MQHVSQRTEKTLSGQGRNGLKAKPPLRKCKLSDGNVKTLLSLFRRKSAVEMEFQKYSRAKEELKNLGGSIGLVENERTQRVEARLEVPTANPTIEDSVYSLVVGMGFELRLDTRPEKDGEKRTYVITERRDHEVSNIVDMAESLVRLARTLKSPEYQRALAKQPPAPYISPENREIEKRSNVIPLRKAS
ncbi:hypothetical protein GF318_03680 [Candidatus Micrarchaeota archaeon]|nr:hypothetical protein [Candidatus Micrarchaeota archaeon]